MHDPGVMDQPQDASVPAEDAAETPSFAPKGFFFQAPAGLAPHRFDPLTPRSADAFLTPRFVFCLLWFSSEMLTLFCLFVF